MYLNLSDVLAYLNASTNSRCFIEGAGVLDANHVVLCGVKEKVMEQYKILGYCLQHSGIKKDPHEINGMLNVSEEKIEILNFHCTCKAGASNMCKHVAAVLLYCARLYYEIIFTKSIMSLQFYQILHTIFTCKVLLLCCLFYFRVPVEELEILSSTDTPCLWKTRKPKAEAQYLPKPLKELKCFGPKVEASSNLAEADQKKILQIILDKCPTSALGLHLKGRRAVNVVTDHDVSNTDFHVTEILQNAENSLFLQNLNIGINVVNNCCRNVINQFKADDIIESAVCNQGSVLWKSKRLYRITGTSCYSVFTYSKTTWRKKVKSLLQNAPLTKEMKHGIQEESSACDAFKQNNSQYDIKHIGLVICKQYPWLAYSPDGILFEEGRPTRLLEIKCPYGGKTKSSQEVLPTLTYLDADYTLKRKHRYYGQIQLGMALLNLKMCDFVVYFAKEKSFLNIIVPFDEEFSKTLIETVSFKYFTHMLHYICRLQNGESLSDSDD